jgi:CRISPR/Cas system CSM-associated protein Csm3 (group 7 of RAMP superfamily)
MKIIYSIQFYSDWHCGSGLNSAADIDALVLRNKVDLPYIPGRTLKGILRESAEILKDLEPDFEWKKFLKECFGDQTDKKSNQSDEGQCYFSNGELSHHLQDKLAPEGKLGKEASVLFRKIASTAIDSEGQAKEHSLRKFEVVVPLTLFAEITNCPEDYHEYWKKSFQWVKRLGTKRNRGFGRCTLSIKEPAL